MYMNMETGVALTEEQAFREYASRFPQYAYDTGTCIVVTNQIHFYIHYRPSENTPRIEGEPLQWSEFMEEIKMSTNAENEARIENAPIITDEERGYLLRSMEELLDEYGYSYRETALNKIIDEWCLNKGCLIAAFKKHPKYVDGKFMIVFDADYERTIDTSKTRFFRNWLLGVASSEIFPEKINKEFVEEIEVDKANGSVLHRSNCDFIPDRVHNAIQSALSTHDIQRVVSEEIADTVNLYLPNVRAKTGEKMSRMVNRMLKYIGYDNHPDYNKEFAIYADSVSPMTITRHTILSINPLDYLTMSFGNSWASCHTIDKRNVRGMPDNYSGCYSSGTISYMLDETSMVLYTVDTSYEGNEFWSQSKIARQMFHYGNSKLVQGRLYPQSNDSGATSTYDQNRKLVQEIIAKIFGFVNLWKVSRGSSPASRYVYSRGTHYRDYCSFESCTLSVASVSPNEECIEVGHDPICIECGEEHCNEESINCCEDQRVVCHECGDSVFEDDAYLINDEWYCRDCVEECEYCGSYYPRSAMLNTEDGYVCESCVDWHYSRCDCCDSLVRSSSLNWISGESLDVCNSCLEEHFTSCDDCGEYIRNEDAIYVDGDVYCMDCASSHVEDEEADENDPCDEIDETKNLCTQGNQTATTSATQQDDNSGITIQEAVTIAMHQIEVTSREVEESIRALQRELNLYSELNEQLDGIDQV